MQPDTTAAVPGPPRHPDTRRPIYHYTTGDRFILIARQGVILPSRRGVEPPEIPAVWLSTARLWEASASKGVITGGLRRTASPREMVLLCGCLARIRIDPVRVNPVPAALLMRDLRIPEPVFLRLLASGLEMGANPSEWLATASPVPSEAWAGVEFAVRTNPITWTGSPSLAASAPPVRAVA